MILWLNGPFGVGKTTVSACLRPRMAAGCFDQERYGFVLKRTVGRIHPGDYQDLARWRRGTVRGVLRRTRTDRPLLVPMTILEPEHLDEIIGGLRRCGPQVLHVTLHASTPVLRTRIHQDAHQSGALSWRLGQIPRYESAITHLGERGPLIDTDHLTPTQVADAILTLTRADA